MSTVQHTQQTRTVDGTEVPVAGTYQLDPSHSSVGFSVRHLMVSKTKGRFGELSATLVVAENPDESQLDVEIQAASVDTRDETRDAHLRSPDFLDVDTFPTLRYRSTSVTPVGKGTWRVDGELTVRDVTLPVPLEVSFEGSATDPWGGARIGFTAQTELDREAFGLMWNQVLESGGVLVGKQVRIDIDAQLVAK